MRGMGGMGGMSGMMAQVQQLQARFKEGQRKLEESVFVGEAASGAVKVELYGSHAMKSVHVDASVVDPDDVEMLEDLINVAYTAAHNEILKANEALTNSMIPPAMRQFMK